MKLTSVEIHPDNSSDVIAFSFRDPRNLNKYNVKDIVGLDADQIIPKYYGKFGDSKFYNLSLEKRDIVIKVGLNPNFSGNESYSDLRDHIYRLIASSRTGRIQLQFKNNEVPVAGISGFIAKVETPQFEKKQELQITINCDEPMLKGISPVNINVAELDPDSTIINDDESTSPHGFRFEMGILDYVGSIVISDPNDSSWQFEISPNDGFFVGDVLCFSSEYNNNQLYVIRGSDTIYLADVILPESVWPIIFPGINTFSFTDPSRLVWNSISYYPTYWGV